MKRKTGIDFLSHLAVTHKRALICWPRRGSSEDELPICFLDLNCFPAFLSTGVNQLGSDVKLNGFPPQSVLGIEE